MKKPDFLCISTLLALLASQVFAAPSTDELIRKKTTGILEAANLMADGTFAKQLLASTDWQHELWDSGPSDQPEKIIQIHILNLIHNGIPRDQLTDLRNGSDTNR